jgi:hypothetical protein
MEILSKYKLLLLLPLIFISCISKHEEQQDIVAEWMGKEILFPSDMQFQILTDTIKFDISDADYKVITFIDSADCVPCKMKLQLWNDLINEFKAIPDVDINFAMVLHGSDHNEIEKSLNDNKYLNPICINANNSFSRANNLSEIKKYSTFLLDCDNKVIAIGNPVTNPKIKKLYKQIILESLGIRDYTQNILCTNAAKNIGIVNSCDTVRLSFEIYNPDYSPYTVQGIVPSCDCVSASIEGSIIPPGKSIVKVKFKPGNNSGPFCHYVDIFFTEKQDPERIVIYGYFKY